MITDLSQSIHLTYKYLKYMKHIIFLIFFAVVSPLVYSQDHYLHITGGIGQHHLPYQLSDGAYQGGLGYNFNLGYSYFFSSHWGITTGIGIQSARSSARLNYLSGIPAVDADGDNYEFRTMFSGWKERQRAMFVDIPLGLQFMQRFKKFDLLISSGPKISLPLNPTYKVTSGNIITTGYYQQWNVELYDLPQHGFTATESRPSGNMKLKTTWSVFFDVGAKYRVTDIFGIYLGAYYNHGLNNLINPQDQPVYTAEGNYNGILNSNQTNKVNLAAVGLKVGLSWKIGTSSSSKKDKSTSSEVDVHPSPKQKKEERLTEEKVDQVERPSTNDVPAETTKVEKSDSDAALARARELADSLNIKFALNSDEPLNPESAIVKELSTILKENPHLVLKIVGHTCDIGSREINLVVGERRAMAAKRLFLNEGVPENQLVTESKAFDEPLVPNTSEENRSINRRVEFKIE